MQSFQQRLRSLRLLLSLSPEDDARPWLELAARLHVEFERVESTAAAFEALERGAFDAIAARWSPRWSKWLATHAPAPPFLHFGAPPNPSLLAAAARGLSVFVCRDAEQVETALGSLLVRPRVAQRLAPVEGVEALLDGMAATLHDFSAFGVSVELPLGVPLEGVVGDRVVPLELRHQGATVLGPSPVRLVRVTATGKGYLVAGTFVEERVDAGAGREITEPTRVEALLTTALQQRGLVLESHDGAQERARVLAGAVDVAGGVIVSTVATSAFTTGALVDVEFEVAAVQYAFTSVVLETSPLSLRLPRRLTANGRRTSERRPCPAGASFQFRHPLVGGEVSLPIADFTPDGLGLTVREGEPALPPGLKVSGLIEVAQRTFAAEATVRRVSLSEGGFHCGLSLRLASGDELGLATLWLRAEFPSLEVATQARPVELMRLFEKTGTAPKGIDLVEATAVLECLHAAPPSLYRPIVLRREGAVVAHAAAIRRYHALWTVQHLTSSHPDRRIAFALLRAGIEVCLNDSTAAFVHGNYAVDNPWSARAMGSGLSGVDGVDRWALPLRQLQFFPKALAIEPSVRVEVSGPTSRVAELAGEAIIASHEPVLLMQAYEWQADQWRFEAFSDEWRAVGLERTRSPLVASIDGEVVAVALLERSSRTLNLREDLSAARVWAKRSLSSADRREVMGTLVAAIARWYGERGMDFWPLISAPDEADAWLGGLAVAPPVGFVEATARRDAVHALSRIWADMAGPSGAGES